MILITKKKVYEKQVLVEAINHFNLLVNKLYEISHYSNKSYDDTIRLQENLIYFERFFKTRYLSNYSEIYQVLNYCYEELEWEELIKLSNKLLNIKKNHQITRRNENIQYSVILIAIFTLCSQLIIYYADFKEIIIFIGGLAFLYLLRLIFKEKISYIWYILKLILKFIYNKVVLLLK